MNTCCSVGSMSTGVVSGLERSFRDPVTDDVMSGLIQVDAAVNPGNSGGPLLDRAGRVVGIVVALLNPTREDVFIGIGLAVPIDVAGGAAGLPDDDLLDLEQQPLHRDGGGRLRLGIAVHGLRLLDAAQ